MSKVIVVVTSDIIADQRIHRTASTLVDYGYEVVALGRRLKSTPKIINKPYKVHLLKLPFVRGILFYASYNIWAFFYLFFSTFDVVQSNDLDTLLAVRLACFLKQKPLVYDSHELFTEVPELEQRPIVKSIWQWLERRLVPSIKYCSTVSGGVAKELKNRYGISFSVIRNLPLSKENPIEYTPNSKIIIYQGALNIGRGLERLIEAMQFVSDATLQIVGSGDIEKSLRKQVASLNLNNKVSFLGRIPLEELHHITCKATIGVSLEEDMGLNYRNALPNKLFDYIQAGLPVLVSDLPEMKRVVDEYKVGATVSSNCNAYALAESLNKMVNNSRDLIGWHKNAAKAAKELVWEMEKQKLLDLFIHALAKKISYSNKQY